MFHEIDCVWGFFKNSTAITELFASGFLIDQLVRQPEYDWNVHVVKGRVHCNFLANALLFSGES